MLIFRVYQQAGFWWEHSPGVRFVQTNQEISSYQDNCQNLGGKNVFRWSDLITNTVNPNLNPNSILRNIFFEIQKEYNDSKLYPIMPR